MNDTTRRYPRSLEEAFPATHTRATSGPVHKRAPFLQHILRACAAGLVTGLIVAIIWNAVK